MNIHCILLIFLQPPLYEVNHKQKSYLTQIENVSKSERYQNVHILSILLIKISNTWVHQGALSKVDSAMRHPIPPIPSEAWNM